MTTRILAVIAVVLIVAAVGGGHLLGSLLVQVVTR